jgi:hypothetical protein
MNFVFQLLFFLLSEFTFGRSMFSIPFLIVHLFMLPNMTFYLNNKPKSSDPKLWAKNESFFLI